MTSAPWIKHVRLGLCAGSLALAAMTGTAWAQATQATPSLPPPQATDDDDYEDHILNTDKRMVDQLLESIGLISRTPGIQYRERSPLVVPAGRDLPPPGAKPAKTADWPTDPDVKLRRAAAKERKTTPPDPAKPITGTTESYRRVETGKWDEVGKKIEEPSIVDLFRSGKMFSLGESKKVETGTFTGEPPRTTLTAPPAGYLTPSPAAPYGVTPRAFDIPPKEKKL